MVAVILALVLLIVATPSLVGRPTVLSAIPALIVGLTASDLVIDVHGAVDHYMYRSIALRKECCAIRKLEPLARALEGQKAWITGLRREQSTARADVPQIDTSEARTKINPLADWTWGDVWHYIAINKVDYNPLHDQFFPSVGCAPCTRAISLGEDFRAGRWWWEDEAAKECGLHVKNEEKAVA